MKRALSLLARERAAALFFAAALLWHASAGGFGQDLLAEIAALALLCLAVDLAGGLGGMLSLGHAALYGIGAYAFAVLAEAGGLPAPLAMLAATLLAGLAAWAAGWAAAEAEGAFFLMVTLAIGQIGYETVFRARSLGGDDGMASPRLDLSAFGVDLFDPAAFALFALIVLFLVYAALAALRRAPFGRALEGLRENEARMAALGLAPRPHKAAAFALSGAVAGLGGTIAAQHAMFITPELLHWSLSGEALAAVILGGLGTLSGALWGATALILLREGLAMMDELCAAMGGAQALCERAGRLEDYRGAAIGVILILAAAGAGGGTRRLILRVFRGRGHG